MEFGKRQRTIGFHLSPAQVVERGRFIDVKSQLDPQNLLATTVATPWRIACARDSRKDGLVHTS